mgnify:CR=1 FL=1
MKKRKGLGRGLSALFGDESSENKQKTNQFGRQKPYTHQVRRNIF